MNSDPIERTKGRVYPVSIGTSVALECFFGVSQDIPLARGAQPPYLSYQCAILNIKTLARNYVSSYKNQDLNRISSIDLYSNFLSEIIMIKNIIEDQSANKIDASFYTNSYYRLKTHLPKATIKQSYTPKQQIIADYETKLCDQIKFEDVNISGLFTYENTNDLIRSGKRHNVIITHYPMDLLLVRQNVDLLESHTGKIKQPYQFPSKLKRAGENVPFNKYTIQLFGDTSGYIMSTSSKIKSEVLKICKDNGVSPVTQEKKFIKILKAHASSELKSAISGM